MACQEVAARDSFGLAFSSVPSHKAIEKWTRRWQTLAMLPGELARLPLSSLQSEGIEASRDGKTVYVANWFSDAL
jgi:hypothetical protein